jgi:hypothetical protein
MGNRRMGTRGLRRRGRFDFHSCHEHFAEFIPPPLASYGGTGKQLGQLLAEKLTRFRLR